MINTQIRLATTDDLHFIVDSWARSLRHTYPNQYAIDFYPRTLNELSELIKECTVVIAHEATDHNEIISWMVYTTFKTNIVVHFAYTKDGARKQGKIKDLLNFANLLNSSVVFTRPAKNENIMKVLASKYIYDPTLAFWRN
jgi:uroporphyrinogen-III decarboxylase